ncbi:MAG: XRE family transcriptional regulator [Actinobacteria bacterium]|nr:XRE family transcriptional regulator [Actinomycetota bacterium]
MTVNKAKTVTLEQVRKQRPTDEATVAGLRNEILAESRADCLADSRRGVHLTQEQLADRIGVDQPRVSRIERGDLARTEVGSLAAYVESMGGTLELVVNIGGKAYPLPVGATLGSQTGRGGTSPAKAGPGKAGAQKSAKKTTKGPEVNKSGFGSCCQGAAGLSV